MQFLRSLVPAVAASIVLAGCGLTTSPADGLNFHAPSGWQGTPGVMGRFQMWVSGGSKEQKQIVMLMKLPADVKLSLADFKANQSAGQPGAMKDATVLQQRKMTLCSNQDSLYVKMQGKSSTNDNQELVEAVITKAPDATYYAMYAYPLATSPDTAAQAAIFEICPSK